ncbi:DUF1156 domain-containing protein [Pseudarthrobacter sp. NamE5]|uniref:DUF1156 domain-containing protein n=1 Tax=Pseudarthrobacter sp. NamE5 TaxID=2576839 RepID=UPI001486E59C|nr:DUF1156 domain-containing protein [Pseudarthrobacter sp. NamE5]
MSETARRKKLIEVALPLDEINAASKADKERKTGTVRNLHKWFAPMPLPAWRALLFAALVDDPEDDNHRVYLLDLIKRLVQNGADLPDQSDIAEATAILAKQFPDGLPTVMDPFCGGGSTLIEAQRLGLPTFGSDLNPVPALISRTLTEVLPHVYGTQPLRPTTFPEGELALGRVYKGYEGLAEDVRFYGQVVLNRVSSAIADAYPADTAEIPVAWLWGRTAKCVNPACGIETVLVTSLWVSKKPGDLAWMEPEVFEGKVRMRVIFGQRTGAPPNPPKVGRGTSFACLACSSVLGDATLVEAGQRGEIGYRLLAVTSTVRGRRVYRAATPAEEAVALEVPVPEDIADIPQSTDTRSFSGPRFGFPNFADLFMPRQLLALAAFADRVAELHSELIESGVAEDRAKAIVSLLGLGVGKLAHGSSTQSRWKFDSRSGTAKAISAFARNDLRLTWDFAEVNPLSDGAMSWLQSLDTLLDALPYAPHGSGKIRKADARVTAPGSLALIATDPPYFDAIDYADLSDYFYMWHRRALRSVHPDLYATVATPKASELISSLSRHGYDKEAARAYFIEGFTETFKNLARSSVPDLPMLVVYASKEQKAGEEETRWSAILTAMVNAELEVTGTWPIHGTGSSRMIGIGTNAVASYIVMSCRPRASSAITTSLSDFTRALRRELGPAVRDLQASSILPVDLAQAAMGPGMQIYSRYRAVLDQAGRPVPVEHALRLINAALFEVLDEQEGELDRESRFAVRWWETHGWEPAPFGEADKAARPLGISVDDVVRAQVATGQANRVQLLGRSGLSRDWTPSSDVALTAWEAVHHLADRLIDGGGELDAARLMGRLAAIQDPAMALTYRLHDIAAKKGRTSDQERYNALINSWAELVRLSGDGVASIEELF